MDLNDPRRRLQVLNKTNPSIRTAAAPKPVMSVTSRPQQKISIAQNQPTQLKTSIAAPQQRRVFVPSDQAPQAPVARPQGNWADFLGGVGSQGLGGMVRDIAKTPTVIKYAKPIVPKRFDNNLDQWSNNVDKFAEEKLSNSDIIGAVTNNQYARDPSKVTIMGQKGSPFGTGVKTVNDAAGLAVAGVGIVKGVMNAPKIIKNIAKVPGLVKDVATGVNTLKSAFKNGNAEKLLSLLSEENDATKIQKALGTSEQVARWVSQETNQDTIKAILDNADVFTEAKLSPGMYTATSPHPSNVPEGMSPPSEPGTPNDRFARSGKTSFNPVTPQTQAIIDDVEVRAMKTARPADTTRVFQTTEANGQKTDWVSSDIDELTAYINSTAGEGTRVDFYDIPNDKLKPTTRSNTIFQAEGDVNDLNKTADIARDLRDTTANPNAKNLVQKASNSELVAAGANAADPDPLATIVRGIAGSNKKAKIRDVLFGDKGLLDGVTVDSAVKNKLVRELVDETDPEAVTQKIINAINNADTEDITKTADNLVEAQTALKTDNVDEAISSVQTQSGTNTPQAPLDAPTAPMGSESTNIGETVSQNADNAVNQVNDAKTMFPDMDPADQEAVQKVLDSLSPAQRAYNKAQKARSQETAQRFAAGNSNYEVAGGGEQGFRAKLSAMKGKKTASGYEPISLDPETENTLLNLVENSDLRSGEKLNTQNSLRKIWGANPEKPAQHDINYIKKFFNQNVGEGVGDEIASGIEEAIKDGRTWKDVAAEIAGLPKSLMATFDLSGLRQAGALGVRYPKDLAIEFAKSAKYAFNSKYYDEEMAKIANSDLLDTITDGMGISLPGAGDISDERFALAGIAEKIPLYGRSVVKGSERAYNGLLAGLRYKAASKPIDAAGGVDNYNKAMVELFGDGAKDAMRAYGNVVNTLSGRGGAKGGVLDQHMATASKTLFSPRLWAANIQRLNPVWYAKAYKANPAAAKLAIQSQGAFLATVGSVLMLAKGSGLEVGTDMRSADFGKIKVGNTRYDIMGGQQQVLVQLWRQATGEKVNSETGEVSKLGEEYGSKNRFDLFLDMLISKSNPLINYAVQVSKTKDDPNSSNPLMREDQFGNSYNIAKETAKLGVPLNIQGIAETSADRGSIAQGAAMSIPGFFGAGVQTYGSTPTKNKGVDETGKTVFKGKVEENMVKDKSGNVMLDDKGKPITVKFPEGATDVEKKAILAEKTRSSITAQYKKNLSGEDQALLKLSDKERKAYVEDGTISQEKYDQLKDYDQQIDNMDGVDIPEGVTSKLGKSYYTQYNSLNKDKQEAWLKGPVHKDAKKITEILNKERVAGLSEFKPSNEVFKAYAEYEKDLNTHPEYTNVDKANKAKAFQTFVYKLNYSEDQKDIYGEGGSSDLKTLISEGSISQKDLDEAIKMDNELYASGLTGSLKFSKKFRNTYGYTVPAKKGDGSGSGSDSETKSQKAYLSNLLPSFKGGTAAPKVSSRARNISFKSGVNLPKKSSRKISIKL